MPLEKKYPVKIEKPVYSNILRRKRLFTLLDEGGRGSLVWICGPAGYGKTTLISSFVDHKKVPTIWYQWDQGDRDPATFYYYLGLACRKETPEKNNPIPNFGPEYSSDHNAFSQRFFASVFDRLPPSSLIVFDNLIEHSEKFFLDALLGALSRIPAGVSIIVVSRSEPPPDLSILGVRDQMKVLGADDLRLDFEEFSKAASLFGINDISEKKLRNLHQKVEGWFAGLKLMAETYCRTGQDPENIGASNIRDVYSFFAGEIGKTLDGRMRDFLIKTSFLPHITIRAAKNLTGYEECEDVLNYLVSHNLFAARKDTEPVTFQYHSLFREYLQKQAAKAMDPGELAKVRVLAANILKDAGQYEHAAALFTESNVWNDLTLLIIENAPDILRQGRHNLLEEWLTSLPEKILNEDRYLQFWMGCCRVPFSPGCSRPYFQRCLKLAREAGDADMTYLAWSSTVETIFFEFDNLYEVDSLIDDFNEIRKEFPDYPSRDVEANVVTSMLTALTFRRLEHPEIEEWAQKAISMARENVISDDQIMVGLIEGMRHFYMGNMVDMRVTIETLVAPVNIRDVGLTLCSLVYYLQGLKEWTLGNMTHSLELIEKGIQISDELGVHVWDLTLMGQGAICALTEGDTKSARNYLAKMSNLQVNRQLGRVSKFDQSHYHYLTAWAAYMEGNFREASSHAQKAHVLKVEIGNPYGIGSNRLALAETLWATGEKQEALKLLKESREIAERTNSGLLSYMCDIAETSFHLDSGQKKKSLETLYAAFAYGSAKSIYNFFWFKKDLMSRLCSLAIEYNFMVGYAQELIDRHQLNPDTHAQELENWPWPVKLYTLGRFELVVKGKKVVFSRKSQERPMSLLKAIVALGGSEVGATDLTEALWPESDGHAGQQALATTLHRLRKILEIEDAVIFSKGSVTLNPKVFWVDIWALERAIGRIRPVLERGLNNSNELDELSLQIEEALKLYKGHFLNNDSGETWSITPRERLRSKYIRIIKNYGKFLENQGEDQMAIQWYTKALEMEHLVEEFYRGLINCYYKLGQKADALSTYNRCKQVLSDVLGVEPSPETEAIRAQVLGKT